MDQDEAKSNENHSSSSRDSNPCPICLGPFLQESYLDSCFHKFCYSCILNWTKVVAGKHSPAPSSVKCPLCKEEDVEIIVHHILGVVDSFLRRGDQSHQMRTPETKQVEFKNLVSDAARPFLAARTERFVNELELFLASGLNIEAYDEVYMQQLGWNTPRLTGEGADVEYSEHTPIVPYLYIFDDDSDETD